jgi:hypothetical protein
LPADGAHANAHAASAAAVTSMVDGKIENLLPSTRKLLEDRVLRSAWTGMAV